MLVPVYQVGRKLPKEIKDKIKRKEYSVVELNNIYKILLKSEKNYGSNLTTNAVVLFIVFAILSYEAIKATENVMFGLLLGIICYLVTMLFLLLIQKSSKKKFLKLIKKYYSNEYNDIININFIDNNYFGGFVISKNITKNGMKAKRIFRKESSIAQCNGWNIYSENDDQEYIGNPSNFEIVTAETVVRFIPEILNIFNAPYGTSLSVKSNNGVFAGFVDEKTGKDVM